MEEIYNFSQDDLLTEDILILDTHAEVFVWVGQSVDSKEKQSALDVGQVLDTFHFQFFKLRSSLTIKSHDRNMWSLLLPSKACP